MPNNNVKGKSGTVTAEEFTRLETLVGNYGAGTLASKVAKICTKMSSGYLHEFPGSPVGSAWSGLSEKITKAVTTAPRVIPTADFAFLSSLVTNYGPELIVQKISRIGGRDGVSAQVTALKTLFPKKKTA